MDASIKSIVGLQLLLRFTAVIPISINLALLRPTAPDKMRSHSYARFDDNSSQWMCWLMESVASCSVDTPVGSWRNNDKINVLLHSEQEKNYFSFSRTVFSISPMSVQLFSTKSSTNQIKIQISLLLGFYSTHYFLGFPINFFMPYGVIQYYL